MKIDCVVCGTKFEADAETALGEIVDCPSCGVELEVTNREPVMVAVFEEEEK